MQLTQQKRDQVVLNWITNSPFDYTEIRSDVTKEKFIRNSGRPQTSIVIDSIPSTDESKELLEKLLVQLSPGEQKQFLAERLNPLIMNIDPINAPQVMGMILEMDNVEVLNLIQNSEILREKVQEAVDFLEDVDY